MSELLGKFDQWLRDGGPAALVIREPLEPVEGADGVFFPPTFAAAEDKTKFAGGYNVDVFPTDERSIGEAAAAMLRDGRLRPTIDLFPNSPNVCLVDSVGSQANRIEPIFSKPGYAALVPHVIIQAGDKRINLLEAGHRAADAVVRCSELKAELQAAFRQILEGNAEPLARIAPTSLVFGVWDSRDTQAKLPRLVASTIRAFDVKNLTRSAQFVPATEYVNNALLDEPADTKTAKAYAERGFIHVPASGSHGGVTAKSIRRDATLSLAALRRLNAAKEQATLPLRRYILGLTLVALTAPQDGYLRQGCNLVPANEGRDRKSELVHASGKREPYSLTHDAARTYAEVVAKDFGVAKERTVQFDKGLAERDIKGEATSTAEAPKAGRRPRNT